MTTINPMDRIDEEVAEHVMGFAAWPCCVHGEVLSHRLENGEMCVKYKPTTNIMHAFLTANHMIEKRGYDFSLNAYNKNMGEDIVYYVQFEIPDEEIQFFADELSPTLAICNAALQAVNRVS